MGRNLRGGLRDLYTPLEAAENGSMSRDLATRFIADTSADPFDGRASREGTFVALIRDALPVLRDQGPLARRSTRCG